MKKIYLLSLSPKNMGFYKKILAQVQFLLTDNENYALCESFEECNICLMLFRNTSEMDHTLINNYLKYEGDLEELRPNEVLSMHIYKLFKENKHKQFFIYTRADQCNIFPPYLKHFLNCDNVISIIKDYLSDDFDNEEFLFHCYKLLIDNDNLREHFNISKFPGIFSDYEHSKQLITMKKHIPDECRKKMECYTFNFDQYGPLFQTPFRQKKKPLSLEEKQYDVFYCKHQRETVDGIARRHIYQNIMPNLEKKFIVKYFDHLDSKDYYNYINKSKIVISPFGLGERVEDDDTCIYFNTIVIKPYPEYDIYDYFNTFTDKNFSKTIENTLPQCIVFCKADFSDIEEVITDILNNYKMHLDKIKLRNAAIDNFIRSNKIKDDFIRILDKCVPQPTPNKRI